MPYVKIQIMREGNSKDQKRRPYRRLDRLVAAGSRQRSSYDLVVIEEVETGKWGVAGKTVTQIRAADSSRISIP